MLSIAAADCRPTVCSFWYIAQKVCQVSLELFLPRCAHSWEDATAYKSTSTGGDASMQLDYAVFIHAGSSAWNRNAAAELAAV